MDVIFYSMAEDPRCFRNGQYITVCSGLETGLSFYFAALTTTTVYGV